MGRQVRLHLALASAAAGARREDAWAEEGAALGRGAPPFLDESLPASAGAVGKREETYLGMLHLALGLITWFHVLPK